MRVFPWSKIWFANFTLGKLIDILQLCPPPPQIHFKIWEPWEKLLCRQFDFLQQVRWQCSNYQFDNIHFNTLFANSVSRIIALSSQSVLPYVRPQAWHRKTSLSHHQNVFCICFWYQYLSRSRKKYWDGNAD